MTPPRPAAATTLALTAGEPAGIGPDLCVQIAQQDLSCNLIVIADRDLLQERARLLRLPLQTTDYFPRAKTQHKARNLQVLHMPLAETAVAGKLNPANARYVLNTLERA